MFDFSTVGGAASFLARMDKDQLQRIMDKAGWSKGVGGLAKQLEEDLDFGLDVVNEALLFACEGLAVAGGEIASGLSPNALDPNFAQAFNLSSRPTSTKKIWLDFDGCIVTNTAWNNANLLTITILPYDTDGNTNTFSSSEMSDIVAVWRAVAEDYAPFDVDVTTIPPASGISPALVSRACIGGDGAWWGSAGGVAYVNIFNTSDNVYYSPAFIFPKQLGNNAKNMWEAVSHEVGHNMGINHDGTATLGYYEGQGDWAPIMGVGYYRNVSQWSKGEYTGANNLEDDTAILAGKMSYVPALNGNSLATATPLATTVSGSTATGTATGIVVQAGAADFFSFTAAAGTATISGQVVSDWAASQALRQRANLDLLITLFNSAGTAIATINPTSTFTANGLGATPVSVALPAAGTYYIAVAGAGSGSSSTTGYSNYGSLGQFGLTVVFPVVGAPVPSPPPSPSPVPVPSPSPSPSPAPVPALAIASANIAGPTASGSRYTCTATITIGRAGTTTPVGGAVVSITWSTLTSFSGFPYNTQVTTLSNGIGTVTSSSIRSGRGCKYTVTAVAAAGYATISTSVSRQISF